MSSFEKQLNRLIRRPRPRDYTYSEASALLKAMGFEESNKGKTSGSRVKFYRISDKRIFMLHKPHPGDVMSVGAIEDFAKRIEEIVK